MITATDEFWMDFLLSEKSSYHFATSFFIVFAQVSFFYVTFFFSFLQILVTLKQYDT